MSLKGWGIILIIIGIGSWILPFFGLQFKLIYLPTLLFGFPEIVSSLLFIVLGAILYYLGWQKRRVTKK